jgi:hypothetical protein
MVRSEKNQRELFPPFLEVAQRAQQDFTHQRRRIEIPKLSERARRKR